MWKFFRKIDNKKMNNKADKNDKNFNVEYPLNSKKSDIFSISDFPERMSKINQAYPLLKEKENNTLVKILELIKRGRHKEARQLFEELNKIRRDIGILDTSKKVMEQTSIRISLIHDIGDVLHTLEPGTVHKTPEETSYELKDAVIDKDNDDQDEMKRFTKSMLENLLKKEYKHIDIESLEEIDRVFSKIMQEKDNQV